MADREMTPKERYEQKKAARKARQAEQDRLSGEYRGRQHRDDEEFAEGIVLLLERLADAAERTADATERAAAVQAETWARVEAMQRMTEVRIPEDATTYF